jgi:diguanylate cyclase (GGDEF)-like protein
VSQSTDFFWRPSPGQAVAFVALMIVVVAQVAWAALSVSASVSSRDIVIGQESDVSTLVFTQRDSLLLVQRWDAWALEEADAQEVVTARGTLAQRLRVKTSTGFDTYELTHPNYQLALAQVDAVLDNLNDDVSNRRAFRAAHQETFLTFARETRQLSGEFQRILMTSSEQAVSDRNRATGIYLGLLAMSTGILALVVVWFGRDIYLTTQRIRSQIAEDVAKLEWARRQLDLVDNLEDASRLFEEKTAGLSSEAELRAHLIGNFQPLLPPGVTLHVVKSTVTTHSKEAASGDSNGKDDETIAAIVGRAQEVLDRAINHGRQARQIEFRSSHDALTGVPNRSHFSHLVSQEAESASRWQEGVVFVAVDIDRFGDLNSSFGFTAGDNLLRQVARRIERLVGNSGVMGRIAADEFALAVVAPTLGAAREVADAVRADLDFTAMLEGVESPVRCSVGAAWVGPGEGDALGGLARAGVALQVAKEEDRFSVVFYDPVAHDDVQSSWKDDLETQGAFHRGEFVMHFQPIVRLESGEIVGAEALIRWEKPGVGLVYPGDFLPGIDRAGLTLDLGRDVIEKTFEAWERILATPAFAHAPYVSINVDPKQLEDPEFARHVIGLASGIGVRADTVVFEVTERDLTSGEGPISHLRTIREAGFRVAVDDFGTGYSSLAQIHTLPVDIVKLDRSFLQSAGNGTDTVSVIRDVVAIAERLELAVIAEGIEDEATGKDLQDLGVSLGQGYLFSPGLAEADFIQWRTDTA